MLFENTQKWQPIQDPDITRRSPQEWANIYNIELLSNVSGAWNEYEWAWNFPNLSYQPLKKDKDGLYDYDSITDKETRADFLRRDLFLGADLGEKEVLKERYIETIWVRNHTLRV
jgi:hypothetical protein